MAVPSITTQDQRRIEQLLANASSIPNLDLRELVKERPEELRREPRA